MSSSLLLFPQRFGHYVLQRSSGVYRTRETSNFIKTTGVACSDSVSPNQVQVLSIPVYYSPVVRIEPQGTNAYNRYTMCPAGQFRVNFWV